MAQKRHVVYRTTHLKDRISWTSGVAGVIRMLTWETRHALGIDKTDLQYRAINNALQILGHEIPFEKKLKELKKQIEKKNTAEINSTSVDNLYDNPKSGLLTYPIEAQRRVRLFREEFLNRELDIFLSLLPDMELTGYLSTQYKLDPESKWTIFGSSNDFEASTGIKFMAIDTIAYSHNSRQLLALELKMDTPTGKDQILKYGFMAAYLELKGMIAKNSEFKLLILGNTALSAIEIRTLLENAEKQLSAKQYPKKGIKKNFTTEEITSLAARASEFIKDVQIKSTTWQEFGDYFDKLNHTLPANPHTETLHKLIDGFLVSLQTKYSRKLKRPIYVR
jgi:hypothetical protein